MPIPDLSLLVLGCFQVSDPNSKSTSNLGLSGDLVAQNAAIRGVDSYVELFRRALDTSQHVKEGTLIPSPSIPFAFSANKAHLSDITNQANQPSPLGTTKKWKKLARGEGDNNDCI